MPDQPPEIHIVLERVRSGLTATVQGSVHPKVIERAQLYDAALDAVQKHLDLPENLPAVEDAGTVAKVMPHVNEIGGLVADSAWEGVLNQAHTVLTVLGGVPAVALLREMPRAMAALPGDSPSPGGIIKL